MSAVRLGAVGYLNARPLVYTLDRSPRFSIRFDVPAVCASLLHDRGIDVGLIPSIEYLAGDYRIVPDLAIASRGPVRSVAIFTKRPISDVRSIAMDTSSRTSVALAKVLCARLFHIAPAIASAAPDLGAMLASSDAALIIGDNALFLDGHAGEGSVSGAPPVEKIDLGEAWTKLTGLPFVWAFWAGREGALQPEDVAVLRHARDEGVRRPDQLAREYLAGAPDRHALGAAYLRDNIKYYFGQDEREALALFYQFAHEAGVVADVKPIRFF